MSPLFWDSVSSFRTRTIASAVFHLMAFPSVSLVAAVVAAIVCVYKVFIYPYFISPLSKIPAAHWSAHFSRLWILNKRRVEQDTPAVHKAHERLGPILRLAPNEISVNCVEGGIRSIYSGGWEKGNWYLNVFNNYGVMPMFAMPDNGQHSRRKRMLSNIYAKSTLQASLGMTSITDVVLNDRFLPRLKQLSGQQQPTEFYDIFCAITMDFVSAYVFGLTNSSNFIQNPSMGQKFFRDYKARQRYQFWPQDLPQFTKWMDKLGLLWIIVPPWVKTANQDIEAWVLSMCDSAEQSMNMPERNGEKARPGDWPNVYAQLRNVLLKESEKSSSDTPIEQKVNSLRLDIASELLDHTLAGFDTSSITLTFLAWELSKPSNKTWQEKLREELATLDRNWDAKLIDALPTLHAILTETLRLHAAIPGNQPRITPPSATLGPPSHTLTNLPANVRVQAQAWSLHRNPVVFPSPETWNPARWLESSEAELKEMQRWFWAFGSGGRMCVGSNLAMLDMKAIVAGIWSEFETVLIDGEGMVHNGGYVAEPVGKDGKYLLLDLRRRPV